MKMKLPRSRIVEAAVVLLVISYPIVSEVIYHRDISPGDSMHFSEFTGKISRKASVRVFDAPDGGLMEFVGRPVRSGLLALPSAAPRYYFDEAGSFVDWVQDPGDMTLPEKFQTIGNPRIISFEEAEVRIRERSQ